MIWQLNPHVVCSQALSIDQVNGDKATGAAAAPPASIDEASCVVCLDEPKTHALVPCGHVCACEGCAKDKIMATDGLCPMCRTQSAQILQVYV